MILIHFCPHDGGPMYEWHWAHYLGELQSIGHKIIDCNPNNVLKRKGSPAENADILKVEVVKLLKNIKKNESILFFGAQARDDNLDPAIILWLKEKGIPCANICVDGFFEHLHLKKIGKYFDINWVTHYNALSINRYGCKVLYMPMAANPLFFARKNSFKKEAAIAFVGSKYGARPLYITALNKEGLKNKVRGSCWLGNCTNSRNLNIRSTFDKLSLILNFLQYRPGHKIILSAIKKRFLRYKATKEDFTGIDLGGPISLEKMVEFHGSIIMSLGISEIYNTYVLKKPLIQYHLRDFECPMIGCAHLVRRCRELEECFEENKNILFYDSIEECVDKAKYYLSDNNIIETKLIGMKARELSINEHTWTKRFKKLCSFLGLKWK